MKICIVHNEYGAFSGEEMVVRNLHHLLEDNQHQVIPFIRRSSEIPAMIFGKVRAFFSGIYSQSSAEAMKQLLSTYHPDMVHIHNLFPLISVSILPECRKAGIPVIMTVHNYRLICPNGLLMTRGQICEKCSDGREYWCVIRNCENSLFKSVGYALRNFIARQFRFFSDHIKTYVVLTEFQKDKLTAQGFPPDRIVVIPNMVYTDHTDGDAPLGDYVGYAGRISPEKGIFTLMNAARKCSDIHFKLAGSYDKMPALPAQSLSNVEFSGYLDQERLRPFYQSARIMVLCSICYEGFPTMIVEAMLHRKPVICSRIGGLSEIVEDGVTGLLVDPGNADDLAQKIRWLWDRPELCRKMGQAGREKALREYSPQKYYERLIAVYQNALN